VTSVSLVKLKGLLGVTSTTLRALVLFIVSPPKVSVVLVLTGTWIPQRGSGPTVVLNEELSGKLTLSDIWLIAWVSECVAFAPQGSIFVNS
jgi:hypothetical protein